jgi:hypothetical protein
MSSQSPFAHITNLVITYYPADIPSFDLGIDDTAIVMSQMNFNTKNLHQSRLPPQQFLKVKHLMEISNLRPGRTCPLLLPLWNTPVLLYLNSWH